MNKKANFLSILVGYLGAMLGLYGVICFNQYVLRSLPVAGRLACLITMYWLPALIPMIIMWKTKSKPANLGFTKENLPRQVLVGILLGVTMSLFFTLVPHLVGLGAFVDNGHRYQAFWPIISEFPYCILAVGAVEELLFRGFFYHKLHQLVSSEAAAILISSLLFGLFHIFGGNILQIIMTTLLGIFWCLCRKKIKYCTTLSLILAHGIYDAMISLWAFLFLQ